MALTVQQNDVSHLVREIRTVGSIVAARQKRNEALFSIATNFTRKCTDKHAASIVGSV